MNKFRVSIQTGSFDGDHLLGTEGRDILVGLFGDDTFEGGAGADRMLGGAGEDTAVYAGSVEDYAVATGEGHGPVRATVTDREGTTDSLIGVEALRFDDYTAWLDGRNNDVLARDDAAFGDQDGASLTGLTDNDFDFDGDALTIVSIDTSALSGSATLNADGSIAYLTDGAFDALAEGETATTRLSYTVTDGNGSFATANVLITVTGENDAPELDVATDIVIDENITTVATATATDVDNGAVLSFSLSGDDAALFAIAADGSLTFAAAPDFEAPGDADGDNVYDVTVTVTDEHGASDSEDLQVTVADVLEIPVVINEVAVNTTGTDWEFVELKGDPGTALDGLQLLYVRGDDSTKGVVYTVIDLDGQVIGENGYFLVTSPQAEETFGVEGNLSMPKDSFVNDTSTVMLVQGDVAKGVDLDGDDDGTLDAPLAIVDSVALRDGSLEDVVYSGNVVGPDGKYLAPGAERQEDGSFRMTSFGDSDDYSPTAGADLPAPLQLSEIAASTTSTDWEFIELTGEPGQSLDGVQIVYVRGDGDKAGIAYDVIDLTGEVIGDNGYFLVTSAQAQTVFGITGNVSIPNNSLLNNTSTVLLINGDVTQGVDLDGDNDGFLDAPLDVIDSVALRDGDAGDVVYSDTVVGPDGSFFAPGAERMEDGTWRMTSFSNSGDYSPTAGTYEGGPAEGYLISEVQGDGFASLLAGETVGVEGVVTAVFSNGFFLQEEDADADDNPMTSEGIFIFTGAAPTVTVADVIYVEGAVAEFFGQTQITAEFWNLVGTAALPTATTISLPISMDATLEAVEGMLVELVAEEGDAPLTIIENFNFDRFGEIVVSEGTQIQPTQIYDAQTEQAEIQALMEANQQNRLTIDDGNSAQNPTSFAYVANTTAGDDGDGILSAGDDFTADGPTLRLGAEIDGGITGVMTYNFGEYKLVPTQTLEIVPETNEGARDGDAPEVGGELTVVSFNALNYFTTLGERGATSSEDLERQTIKLVNALVELDGDIVGLQEIENNGFGDGSAIDALVDALNARLGSEVYAYVDPTEDGGPMGTDAITTGIIYKIDSVDLLASDYLVFADGDQQRNRPAIAAAFEDVDGEVVTIVNNHFKSKGGTGTGGDADIGDGQGNWNETRTDAAIELAAWLEADPLGVSDPDVLIIGDLNAYSREDPVQALEAAGYENLIEDFIGLEDAFSFIFDGQSGALDHALASESLADQVIGVAEWHINAQEPDLLAYSSQYTDAGFYNGDDVFAASDHDPLIIGLTLGTDTIA